MNTTNQPQEYNYYELAASAHSGRRIRFNERALLEVCNLHSRSIARARSLACEALEKGRYAIFILEHIDDFCRCRRGKLRQSLHLLSEAIAAMESMENQNPNVYKHFIYQFKEYAFYAREQLVA